MSVNGGVSPVSPPETALSYSPPVISGFEGAGDATIPAATSGGQRVRIKGNNFGTAQDAVINRVTYSPITAPDIVFEASSCNITDDHFEMECVQA